MTLLGGIQRVAERAGGAEATSLGVHLGARSGRRHVSRWSDRRGGSSGGLLKAAQAWAVRLGRGPTRAHAGHKQMLRAWSDGGIEAADKLLPALTTTLMQNRGRPAVIASAIDALSRGVDRPDLDFHGR